MPGTTRVGREGRLERGEGKRSGIDSIESGRRMKGEWLVRVS